MKNSPLPEIAVEINQPNDKGNFVVTVYDSHTRSRITQNTINEKLSVFEYIYTARLIEGGGLTAMPGDTDLLRQDRQADLTRYGHRLYRELFGKDDRFRRYLARQKHLKGGARIVLQLHDTASELWNVPWEYMHDGERFLGVQPQYPIIRKLKDATLQKRQSSLTALPKPLRMLFVISNPRDAAPLNVDDEIARVQNAVADARRRGDLEIDIVADGTLENLQSALKQHSYHILHYSGHGAIAPQGSCLVLENEHGLSRPVFLPELLPILRSAHDLRFVFLSACKAGNITETAATSGIATGLMTVIPTVVAMQFSIRDNRANQLARVFYQYIGQGGTVVDALHRARRDLHKDDATLGDWGVPTLYTHEPNMRLLQPTRQNLKQPQSLQRVSGLNALPEGRPFIGRHDEQRQIRTALNNAKVSLVYLWGMSGFGKSALVRQTLDHANIRAEHVLVIDCRSTPPDGVMKRTFQWLMGRFPALKPIIAANLRATPEVFIAKIAPTLQKQRMVLILDGAEQLMHPGPDGQQDFVDSRLRAFLVSIAAMDWSLMTIIASTFRWSHLKELDQEYLLEMHIGSLPVSDAIFVVNGFANFKGLDQEIVNTFFTKVGGHPATLHVINEKLKANPDLLRHPQFAQMLAKHWQQTFLADILAMLKPQERQVLQIISVHHNVFNPNMVRLVADLPHVSDAEAIMIAWETLSLAEFVGIDEDDTPWYIIPNLVVTCIEAGMDTRTLQDMHYEIADAIEHSFFQTVQENHRLESRPMRTDADARTIVIEEIEIIFRNYRPEVVGHYLDLAYTWQSHYRDAGEIDTANRIAVALLPTLRQHRQYAVTERLLGLILADDALDLRTRLEMSFWQAVLRLDQRQEDEALTILTQIAKQSSNRAELKHIYIDAVERQAELLRNRGKIRPALEKLLDVRDYRRERQDRVGLARVSAEFVQLAYYGGETEAAARGIDVVLDLLEKAERSTDDLRVVANMLLLRGEIMRQNDDILGAMQNYDLALEISRSLSDGPFVARALETIGYTYGLLRQYDTALEKLLAAIDIYEAENELASLSIALTKLAVVQMFRKDANEAVGHAERALRLARAHAPANVAQTEKLLRGFRRRAR